MEDLLYRNESSMLPEKFADESPESLPLPIDLNRASAEELEASGIFTPYQVYQLQAYRQKFGALYSIHELAAIPGFNASFLRKIESLVSLNPASIHESKKSGKHMALVKLERSYPYSEEFKNYSGPPFRSSIRIRSKTRTNLTLALSYDKDAGETFFYKNMPQFISGYLSYEGKSFFKQLVFGNYQLNQGLGLVNGSGFIHRAGDFRITRRSFSGIRPYASLTESMYEQGMACRMGTDKFQFALWASYHKISLSPSVITEHPETEQWIDYQRTTGLYRTENELEARDLAYRIHSGIQLLYRNQGLSVGVLSGSEWVGPGKKAIDLLEESPDPSKHQKLSLHGNWYKRKLQVFGEIAVSAFHSPAFLLGACYQFNDFIKGNLLLHHYDSGYRGSLPSSYNSGSGIRNEQGLAFHLHMEPGKAVTVKFTGELFQYPSPRYLTKVPSSGYRLDLSLQNPTNRMLQWRARVVRKSWQTSPANEKFSVRPLEDSRVTRIDGQLIYMFYERFRWLNRLVIGHYSYKQNTSTGYAAVQQLTFNSDHFRLVAQFVLFHVSEWANRIYLYEPGFYYSFNFPVYYGFGQRTTLLIRYKVRKGLAVSVKISRKVNGGNQSWGTGIQLRVNV